MVILKESKFMDFQRPLPKTDHYFVITVLEHIDSSSIHFFFVLLELRIGSFTEVTFNFKQFLFWNNTSPSGFTVSLVSRPRVPP